MNILSVFDGMRCASIALQLAKIPVSKYYSSEIDKHANRIGRVVYPNAIEIGDIRFVTNTKNSMLQFVEQDQLKFINDNIDFLLGGSPCQSFSMAGKKNGMTTIDNIEVTSLQQYLTLREQNFEFEGQSYLFWEYVRLFHEFKPKYFFLENVSMVDKWKKIISKTMGVNPIELDSAKVSAQQRVRLYWTNLGMAAQGLFALPESIIKQPKDCNIYIKDILEPVVDAKYYLSKKFIEYFIKNNQQQAENGNKFNFSPIDDFDKKSKTISTKEGNRMDSNYIKINKKGELKPNQNKASCFTAGAKSGGNHSDMDLLLTRTIKQLNKSKESNNQQPFHQNRVYDVNGIAPSLMANHSDLIIKLNNSQSGNVYSINGKSANLCANGGGMGAKTGLYLTDEDTAIRRFTPRECGRLQTIPETILENILKSGVSDTQLYKAFGNGWTINAIVHILNYYHTKP